MNGLECPLAANGKLLATTPNPRNERIPQSLHARSSEAPEEAENAIAENDSLCGGPTTTRLTTAGMSEYQNTFGF